MKYAIAVLTFLAGLITGALLMLSVTTPACRPVVGGLPMNMQGWGFILWALVAFIAVYALIVLGLLALASIVAMIISILRRQPLKKVFAALVSFRWQDLEVRSSDYTNHKLQ